MQHGQLVLQGEVDLEGNRGTCTVCGVAADVKEEDRKRSDAAKRKSVAEQLRADDGLSIKMGEACQVRVIAHPKL